MVYTDRLLAALGAWRRGWREDPGRREAITNELRAALPSPTCRTTFALSPENVIGSDSSISNNPQNHGDCDPDAYRLCFRCPPLRG